MAYSLFDYTRFREPNLLIPGKKPIGSVRYKDGVSGRAWMLNRSLTSTKGDKFSLTSIDWRSTPKGPALQSTLSSSEATCTFDSSFTLYGFVWHFYVEVADITTSLPKKDYLAEFATNMRLAYGPITTYLTGETLTLSTTDATRTAIGEAIAIGEHVVAMIWNGSEYEIWLDRVLPTQLEAAAGHAPLITVTKLDLQGRLYGTDPRIDTLSVQLFDQPMYGSGKILSADPYQFLEPA